MGHPVRERSGAGAVRRHLSVRELVARHGPLRGRAGARAQDSSTAFWNPAGMTELGEGTEVMFGLGALFAELNPKLDADTVTPNPPVVSGSNIAGFAPLFGSFLSTKLPYDVHAGMVVTTLYGGAVDYNQNWTGRTFITDNSPFSLLIQPSLAYAVTDWLSLGAGPTVLYTTFDQRRVQWRSA
jgi:long-chain fatty acid transport protein